MTWCSRKFPTAEWSPLNCNLDAEMWGVLLAGLVRPFTLFAPCWPARRRVTDSALCSRLWNDIRRRLFQTRDVLDGAYGLGVGRSAFSVGCFSSMRIDIVTLFPEICRGPLSESIMKRAQENRIVDLHIHNLRDWTTDKHHVVDDAPFGGGQGMVMKPEPIFAAVEELKKTPNIERSTSNAEQSAIGNRKSKILLMSPAGRRLDQQMAQQLSQESHLIIISGHYEGVDHRVIEHLIDLEISIGDYVLTN